MHKRQLSLKLTGGLATLALYLHDQDRLDLLNGIVTELAINEFECLSDSLSELLTENVNENLCEKVPLDSALLQISNETTILDIGTEVEDGHEVTSVLIEAKFENVEHLPYFN